MSSSTDLGAINQDNSPKIVGSSKDVRSSLTTLRGHTINSHTEPDHICRVHILPTTRTLSLSSTDSDFSGSQSTLQRETSLERQMSSSLIQTTLNRETSSSLTSNSPTKTPVTVIRTSEAVSADSPPMLLANSRQLSSSGHESTTPTLMQRGYNRSGSYGNLQIQIPQTKNFEAIKENDAESDSSHALNSDPIQAAKNLIVQRKLVSIATDSLVSTASCSPENSPSHLLPPGRTRSFPKDQARDYSPTSSSASAARTANIPHVVPSSSLDSFRQHIHLSPQQTSLERLFPNALESFERSHQRKPSNSFNFYIVAQTSSQAEADEGDEFPDKKFIEEYNEHPTNPKKQAKAMRLILKMRELGNLANADFVNKHLRDPKLREIATGILAEMNRVPRSHEINIQDARLGLCILSQLTDNDGHPHKRLALESLIELLREDPLTESSAKGLLDLLLEHMKSLSKEMYQSDVQDTRIKIAKVFSIIAELLCRQYAKGHIDAVMKELKGDLTGIIDSLKSLNTLENKKLDFYIKSALEGILRLKDDSQKLLVFMRRIAHLAAAAFSVYSDSAGTAIKSLQLAFAGINIKKKKAWYDSVLVLHDLKQHALSNENALIELQKFIGEMYSKLNWKFTYAALKVLHDVSLRGTTPAIRLKAFNHCKVFGDTIPGMTSFTNLQKLETRRKFSDILRAKWPRKKDPNLYVRRLCVDYLKDLLEHSQDDYIKLKARDILLRRRQNEANETLRNELSLLELPNNFEHTFRYRFRSLEDRTQENHPHEADPHDASMGLITIVPSETLERKEPLERK